MDNVFKYNDKYGDCIEVDLQDDGIRIMCKQGKFKSYIVLQREKSKELAKFLMHHAHFISKDKKVEPTEERGIVNEDGLLPLNDIPEWKVTEKEKEERRNDHLNKIKVLSIMGDILEKMDLAKNSPEAYVLKHSYIKSLQDILDTYESTK